MWTGDENGTLGIRFGLGGVKNVGRGAVELIEKERAHGAFANIFDFAERVSGGDAQQADRGKPDQGGRL